MGKSSLAKNRPPTLEQLIDLFNERKISAEELAKKATPLLLEQRQHEIFLFMLKLAAENPEYYHITRLRDTELYRDAEAAYEAKAAAELAARPRLRVTMEETARRVEATFNQAEDQSDGI